MNRAQGHHRLAGLIDHAIGHDQRAAVRFGARGGHLQDFGHDMERVAWSDRLEPSQLVEAG